MGNDRVVILGGASSLGRAIASEVTVTGRSPVIVDVVEAPVGKRTIYADIAPADLADAVRRTVGRLQALVVCASIEESQPGILRRCLDVLVAERASSSVVVGVAAAQKRNRVEGREERVLRADAEVVRCLRRLEIVYDDVAVCTVLHGPLAPAFEDCRGDIQEMPEESHLGREDVAAAVGFVLTRPEGHYVRQLQLATVASPEPVPAPRPRRHPATSSLSGVLS